MQLGSVTMQSGIGDRIVEAVVERIVVPEPGRDSERAVAGRRRAASVAVQPSGMIDGMTDRAFVCHDFLHC